MVSAAKKETIYAQGEASTRCFMFQSGKVRLTVVVRDGGYARHIEPR
jgi:hypothetical protein